MVILDYFDLFLLNVCYQNYLTVFYRNSKLEKSHVGRRVLESGRWFDLKPPGKGGESLCELHCISEHLLLRLLLNAERTTTLPSDGSN